MKQNPDSYGFALLTLMLLNAWTLTLSTSPCSATVPDATVPDTTVPDRGYVARGCGLDMNRNGIVGERADCRVCDGSTLDPDQDGIAEDLFYIDCDQGVDAPNCGAPSFPCRTVGYTWNERTDGPQDNAEDILCLRGVCIQEENIAPRFSGIPRYYVLPRSGSEARDWQLPAHPTMLVGWDQDHDGDYPPHDPDDVAVFDGAPLRLSRTFSFNQKGVQSFIELAHFTVRDYGNLADQNSELGFLKVGKYGPVSSHVYFHDLALLRINRGRPSHSSTIVFNFFRGGTQPRWWAFNNILVTEMASWLTRGAGPDDASKENGPFRFQNLTVTAHGCSASVCGAVGATTMFKLWGYVSGVEILDSVFDLQAAAWQPGGNPSHGITPAQCSRDWTIRNNEFIDFQKVLNVKGYAPGFCDGEVARPTDDVVFDRNLVRNTYNWGSYGDESVLIGGGNSPLETVADVTITNNYFQSDHQLVACLWAVGGNLQAENPGKITFVGNTCATHYRYAALMIGDPAQPSPYPHENLVIKNNLLHQHGLPQSGPARNFWLTYAPQHFEADHNLLDQNAGFVWSGVAVGSLTEWRNASRGDFHSRDCVPELLPATDGIFKLSPLDLCARDGGVFVAEVNAQDLEGDRRSGVDQEPWDIGADEVEDF